MAPKPIQSISPNVCGMVTPPGNPASSLLCIVGELTGGGSVAVAVGVDDR